MGREGSGRKKGKKMPRKGRHICEFLNTDGRNDDASNNDHLPACDALPGIGSEDAISHSVFTRSCWGAVIQGLLKFRNLAKVIHLARTQPQTIGLQTPCS